MKAVVHLPLIINMGSHDMVLAGWIEHYGSVLENGHYITFRVIDGRLFRIDDNLVIEVDLEEYTTSSTVTILLYCKPNCT